MPPEEDARTEREWMPAVRRKVDAAPPLTQAQREALRVLLRPPITTKDEQRRAARGPRKSA